MKIFRWKNPAAKYLVGAFVVLFLLGFVRQCRALELSFDGGASTGYAFAPRNGDGSYALEASVRTDNRHWDLSAGYIGPQYDIRGYGYVSGQYVVYFPLQDLEPFLGLGGSWWYGSDSVEYLLPSTLNFSLSAGIDTKRHWRLEYRHFSNAGTRSPNRGQNFLLIGYRF